MSTAPSSIARTIAAAEWPDVQQSEKLAPGIFWYSCAGHGGAVAVIGVADLPENAVEIARKEGRVELVAVTDRAYRGQKRFTTARYTAESVREVANRPGCELFECWVGEEDCAWATIALVSPAMREGMGKRNGNGEPVTEQEVRECCQRWNEDYLVALEPGYEPLPDGPIAQRRWREQAAAADEPINCSAWGDWADGVPDGHVRVLFRHADGRETSYLMAKETYDARSTFGHEGSGTLAMFRAAGELLREATGTVPA